MKQQDRRGDVTREALVLSAMETFASHGFEAVSTRQLSQRSGVNQALIGYHFGSKQGLYLAVFEHISTSVQARVGPLLGPIQAVLDQPLPEGAAARRSQYLPPLLGVVEAMLGMMLSPETEHWAQLIQREQARPTAAFDLLYQGFMGRLLEVMTQLVMRLRGDADSLGARLLVVGILGQVVVWRAARAGVLRHLGWGAISADDIARVKAAARQNITAQLLAEGGLHG